MGPRVLFREKDNPERRYDYLDEIIGTIGKGTLGLTVNCARCHNHKFDPISQKDYYALEASIFGYVETEVPLAPKPRPRPIWRRTPRSTRRSPTCRHESTARAAVPRHAAARADQAQVSRARSSGSSLKPENDRTPGEALLATQVLKRASVSGPAGRSRADARRRRQEEGRWRREIAALDKRSGRRRCRWPRSPPMATIAPRRSAKATTRSVVPSAASRTGRRAVPAHRTRALPGAAFVFPDARRRREPRIADEAGLHRGHHRTAIRRPKFRAPTATRRDAGSRSRSGSRRRRIR